MDLSYLSGCGTALVTPFRADGAVDDQALHDLVHWQIEEGIRLLIACGSTGEASTLTEEETLAVARMCISTAGDRAMVLVGCSHNSTVEAVRRARRVASLSGIGGILTACPYYNKPSQEGMYLHFKAIAEAVAPVPVVLYNVPGRTASNLLPATVARLAEIPNIVGIKESSGNMVQIVDVISSVPRGFRVLSGDDAYALPTIDAGAVGIVSVASNVAPKLVRTMVESALGHDDVRARHSADRLADLIRDLFAEPSPGPVKSILSMMGKIDGEYLRLPMTAVTVGMRRRLERTAGELGLLVHAPATGEDLRMF